MSRPGIAKPKKVYVMIIEPKVGNERIYIENEKAKAYRWLKNQGKIVGYSLIEGKVIDVKF